MTNLVTEVRSTAEEHADHDALWSDGTSISYAELFDEIGRFAAALEDAGVGVDDRVAIYLPNVPQFVTAFHGTLAVGGVVVPMNPQYRSREIGHLLADSGARVVVTIDALAPVVSSVLDETALEQVVTVAGEAEGVEGYASFLAAEPTGVVDRSPDDMAVQPYTSGTTGTPKGVMLTHHNLRSNTEMVAELVPDGIRTDDRSLGVLPLFHIYGMTVVMNATLFNGGTFYAVPAWDAHTALELIEGEQLTMMHGVPAMYNDIINQPNADTFDLSSLRLSGVGGAGIPLEVAKRFEELYSVTLYEGYGLTETSPVTHFNSPIQGRRLGSIGRPVPGIDAMVVDESFKAVDPVPEGPLDNEASIDEVTGEIVINGPNVMKGYFGRPEANETAFTEMDGQTWFHSGDIGYHDEDGYFYVVDRAKHVIVTGGYNVYPREVEELLFEHAAVADAAVVGIPDERRGETVKAYVVRTPTVSISESDLQAYCLEQLAAYKHPREIEFVEDLPRTTTGKVQKFELRRMHTEGHGRPLESVD